MRDICHTCKRPGAILAFLRGGWAFRCPFGTGCDYRSSPTP